MYATTRPSPTDTHTLSLHDALPIYYRGDARGAGGAPPAARTAALVAAAGRTGGDDLAARTRWDVEPGTRRRRTPDLRRDRKSTRLNSSHDQISYAVFCLKKKTKRPI